MANKKSGNFDPSMDPIGMKIEAPHNKHGDSPGPSPSSEDNQLPCDARFSLDTTGSDEELEVSDIDGLVGKVFSKWNEAFSISEAVSKLFLSCFISHSSKDRAFCDRLTADLKSQNVNAWYFPEDAKWGEGLWSEIDHSIKTYDKLIVVCSKNSLISGPVLREIERALNREDKEAKSILFPIRIDDYIFTKWEHPRKEDVLSKVIGDFSSWNTSIADYQRSFKKLLEAIRAI
jgi:hypothetical protein